MKKIFNLFRSKKERERINNNLPKEIFAEWFAAVVHSRDSKLPPAFDKNGDFINYKIDDIVPLRQLEGGAVGFYKIVKITYRRGDWLYDTDGYKYDLVYSHVAEFKTEEK